MTKWEYLMDHAYEPTGTVGPVWLAKLNKLGAQGWELVAVRYTFTRGQSPSDAGHESFMGTFKRPIE